jgi:hypothetical protein
MVARPAFALSFDVIVTTWSTAAAPPHRRGGTGA